MKARVIAFYLPQFHEIPENNEWWGKGFTEWTSVRGAKPLFKGHVQPKVPGELGYYNLLDPEIRERQAELAREAGIEGFIYWHYWFGNGKQLLERPFNEVLQSGKPDFPFCLGWANHTWSRKTWTKYKNKGSQILMEQTYPGDEDIVAHFYNVLPAFKDHRYITVDGRPLFLVWAPLFLPNPAHFMEMWNRLAVENGLEGIHFVGLQGGPLRGYRETLDLGFDALNWENFYHAEMKTSWVKTYLFPKIHRFYSSKYLLKKYHYKDIISNCFTEIDKQENIYPTVVTNYDRSPRGACKAVIFYGSTPELFKQHVQQAVELVQHKQEQHRLIFLRSWNEWGEGNYLEPDAEFGRQYLEAVKECLLEK